MLLSYRLILMNINGINFIRGLASLNLVHSGNYCLHRVNPSSVHDGIKRRMIVNHQKNLHLLIRLVAKTSNVITPSCITLSLLKATKGWVVIRKAALFNTILLNASKNNISVLLPPSTKTLLTKQFLICKLTTKGSSYGSFTKAKSCCVKVIRALGKKTEPDDIWWTPWLRLLILFTLSSNLFYPFNFFSCSSIISDLSMITWVILSVASANMDGAFLLSTKEGSTLVVARGWWDGCLIYCFNPTLLMVSITCTYKLFQIAVWLP